ncbi:uncharacterized protein LOC144130463 [Amblyomma americanum]
MHKTKGCFPGGRHIPFGHDEDETPLTERENRGVPWSSEAMASRLEAYYNGVRHQTRQNTKPKKQRVQRLRRRSALAASWCEEQPLSAFSRLGHTPASQKRHHWSTTWYMQMSAVVVVLALAALIGLTFALRHADKVRDAGQGLDVDIDDVAGENATDANATSHEHAAVDDGGDAASSTGNGSKKEEHEQEPRPASGYTRTGGGQSKISAYSNTRVPSAARQPSAQETFTPQEGAEGTETARRRTLVRMNRKEWLNNRGWHLT